MSIIPGCRNIPYSLTDAFEILTGRPFVPGTPVPLKGDDNIVILYDDTTRRLRIYGKHIFEELRQSTEISSEDMPPECVDGIMRMSLDGRYT